MDELWTGWSCRNAEIAWEEAANGGATLKGMMWVDGTRTGWTSCGRAGAAAEIAWEEARDGGATSKGMMWVDGTWTSRGRAGAAEIAWEEAIGTEERHRRG